MVSWSALHRINTCARFMAISPVVACSCRALQVALPFTPKKLKKSADVTPGNVGALHRASDVHND
jgi:hypothetical protein